MSLFGDLDIASAADNPWAIPDNTYECVVSDLEVKKNKSDNMGMTITFKVSGGQYDGFKIVDYLRIPHPDDAVVMPKDKAASAMSFIKARLGSLGIPDEEMNSVGKDDLIGIDCYVTTKMDGDYVRVRKVTIDTSDYDM